MPLKEACGLFGIVGAPDAVDRTYQGLYSLQHRGQESAGIASTDGRTIKAHRAMGLVADVFSAATLKSLQNPTAIGHVRYSTTGASLVGNAQPLVVTCGHGPIAVAHNGNLVNSATLRRLYEATGSIFQTTTDSEVILHLLARTPKKALGPWLREALRIPSGAFSILLLTPEAMIAVRDPHGYRPLALGRMGASPVIASETCAFDLIGAVYERDVAPGEILILRPDGQESLRLPDSDVTPAHCVFEHVYFARPDSRIFGENVHLVRKRLGARLAEEHPADADMVIPVPDSGNSAALGFAQRSGLPLENGFIRNHYVGRTFIQPTQGQRSQGVEIKLNIVREVVAGKRVVVVDDSVIRGTTSRNRVRKLREAGAKEVHLRISCPPTRHGCYYGIDFPDPKELIANNLDVEQIRRHLGLDSLGYLSVEGMLGAMSFPGGNYCTACWTGQYRVLPSEPIAKDAHERMPPVPPVPAVPVTVLPSEGAKC